MHIFLFCHTRFLMRISSSLWASHTASSLPMMVMCSCSCSSGDGKMIRAPVRSRTRRILAPPLPIRNLWYSGLAWSSTEKLLTCCWDKRQMSHIDWITGNITAFPAMLSFFFCFTVVHLHPITHLLFSQLQQLSPGSLHLLCRTSDSDLVQPWALRREVDMNTPTLFHYGAHQTALGSNQRVVQLGWDGNFSLLQVGLGQLKD